MRIPQTHAQTSLYLIVVCLLLFLSGFFTLPPTDRDESRFAQATKQMVASGDYVNIRLQNVARNKKPVGIHWLQAATVKISSYGEAAPIWVYRIPSLLGAIAAVLLTYWALLPLMQREEAFFAALLLASCVLLSVEARLAKTDAVLLATTTATMGALLRIFLNHHKTKAVWLFWLALSASFLIKGPIVLLVAGGAAVFLSLWKRSAAWLKETKSLFGIPFFIAVNAPWYIAIIIMTNGEFLQGSVGHDMFGKVVGGQETHGGWPGTYLVLVWFTFFFASCFLASMLPRLKQVWRQENIFILLAWIVPTWIVFELVPTKLPHYVLPVYPALAGLVAILLSQNNWQMKTRWQTICMSSLVWVPAALLVFGFFLLLLRGEHADFVLPVLAAATVWLGFMAFRKSQDNVRQTILLSVMSAILLYFGIFQRVLPNWREMWLSPRLAEAVQKNTPCENPLLASVSYHEPSLVFATRTDILLTDGAGAAEYLMDGGCRVALIDEARANDLNDFQQRLRHDGISAKRLTAVDGRNVNGGTLRHIGLWMLEK
ncbi:MAG: glycosyltransferase family 39 protein [Pseudomonadota bacterium]